MKTCNYKARNVNIKMTLKDPSHPNANEKGSWSVTVVCNKRVTLSVSGNRTTDSVIISKGRFCQKLLELNQNNKIILMENAMAV